MGNQSPGIPNGSSMVPAPQQAAIMGSIPGQNPSQSSGFNPSQGSGAFKYPGPPPNPAGISGWGQSPPIDPSLFGGNVPGWNLSAPAANPAGIPGWGQAPPIGSPPSNVGKGG